MISSSLAIRGMISCPGIGRSGAPSDAQSHNQTSRHPGKLGSKFTPRARKKKVQTPRHTTMWVGREDPTSSRSSVQINRPSARLFASRLVEVYLGSIWKASGREWRCDGVGKFGADREQGGGVQRHICRYAATLQHLPRRCRASSK